ncbi:Phospholipase/lecithinase/hemolysin [Hahella chejuensis KCTC 2396]|uniref:Phospholipase/lecithinase/hemolysin n=2 Tax=Hahella chejuensis TaxID=158327 RepID=Q2SA57_HAHCH|nr:Phospholipase/lecithinase/hemolysin [Hahella chejuensis KCTC 2396]
MMNMVKGTWKQTFLAPLACAIALSGCQLSDDEEKETSESRPFSALYVFGDSLSDTGNIGGYLSLETDLPSPFYDNRISNGKLIVDYVAESLNLEVEPSLYLGEITDGTNYAVAGGQADADQNIDLDFQVDTYMEYHSEEASPKALYLFFIGGNDILEQRGETSPNNTNALNLAADKVAANVQEVIDKGGKNIVVLTVPDVGKTPKVLKESAEPGQEGRSQLVSDLTVYFNSQVELKLSQLNMGDTKVTMINSYQIALDILNNAADYGFTNTTDGCYVTEDLEFSDICSEEQFDNFYYFDNIHPSGKTHRLIGEKVAAEIPDPAES